jgi:hypothetical protein
MSSQKICKLASCATKALDDSVCAVVSVAALEQYAIIVDLVKQYTCIDINEFFTYIALLAVLCWVSQWLNEIIHFLCKTIPKFLKNLMCGKFTLCLLDCGSSHSSSRSSRSHKSHKSSTQY